MIIAAGHAQVPAWTRKVNDNDPIFRLLAIPVGGIEHKWAAGAVAPRIPVGHMSENADRMTPRVSTPSVERSLSTKLLPTVMSVIAGNVDVIGFLGLGSLFTAHVTGNLVILAANVSSSGAAAPVAPMLAVPVFIVALGVTRLLIGGLDSIGRASLLPLLLLQLLLLAGCLVLGICAGSRIDPDAPIAIAAAMLGVSAMAVQNALGPMSLKGAPSTAVMTTNIGRFIMDVGGVMFGRTVAEVAKARSRTKSTWPVIVGFAVGCGLGAACEVAIGLRALAPPTGLALLAFAMGLTAHRDGAQP